MSNSRKLRNKQRNSKKISLRQEIMNLSEVKIRTDNSHHFPLNSVTNLTYSDSGIYVGGWTCYNRVPQGLGNNDRIGNTITNIKAKFAFTLYAPSGSPDSVRILVVKDLAPKGTWPALVDMFDNPGNNLTVISPNCRTQYQIIHESNVDIGGYLPVQHCNFTVNSKINTKFVGGGGNLLDIENGALYIIVFSVNSLTSTEVLGYYCSTFYHDL